MVYAVRLPDVVLKGYAIDKQAHQENAIWRKFPKKKKETFSKPLSLTWEALDLRKRKGPVGKDRPSECGADAVTTFLPQLPMDQIFSALSLSYRLRATLFSRTHGSLHAEKATTLPKPSVTQEL